MEYIVVTPSNIKNNIIKLTREKDPSINAKFMSLEEIRNKFVFTYDERAIYYLMNKYQFKYEVALIYLNNLYYISDKLDNKKMKKLKEIKSYLDKENLLIYDKYFKDYLKDKKIIIYGYDIVPKYYINLLNGYNYEITGCNKDYYEIDKVYSFDTSFDEITFVCNKVSLLIKVGISFDNIKIIAPSEYNNKLERIFNYYNFPYHKKVSIYSSPSVKRLLNNIEDYQSIIESMEEGIKTKIINIFNKYYFIDDKTKVKNMIIHDLKNTYIDSNSTITNINDYIDDNDYVFLLGFNKENIPILLTDSDYFSDKDKIILDLDTSSEQNSKLKTNLTKRLHSIKNLTITYKKYDNNKECLRSTLLTEVRDEYITGFDYNSSNMINKVLLTRMLDNLVKYNIKANDLDLLYSNYRLPFMTYDNKYTSVDKDKLYKYLDNKLLLSYTSLDNYNKCKFKYYLSNVLKLNIVRNDFAIIIGNVCHYCLSKMDDKDFDIDSCYDNYLKETREFTNKEKYFLTKVKKELIFIIDTIKKQMTYTTFDKKMMEEKVYINKDKNIKVTFMGIIDKLLYKEEDNITYLVVIDYKTGSTNIKLDNMKYGIGMQLPIYLYLSKNMKLNNTVVVGFYLQKLLTSTLDNTKDYITAKENTLKLEGYSLANENILSKFDKTYNDSKLIKSMKTSSNGFYSYSKVLDEERIDNMITMTDKIIDNTIDSILDSNFAINPKVIDGEMVGCSFCEYKDICFMKENDKVYINSEDEEKWEH